VANSRFFSVLASLLVAASGLAGCLGGDEDNGNQDGGGTTGTAYALTTTGVPAQVDPAKNFTFTLRIEGKDQKASPHIGAHYGTRTSTSPSTSVYNKVCQHTAGNAPGTYNVTCRIDAPGTYYLRGHLQFMEGGQPVNYWANETVVRVKGFTNLGTIKVGTDAAFPPFENVETETGEFVGFDIDLMREIGNRSNFTVEFQNLGFDPLIPALQNGQIRAAISAMSITENRSKQVDFSIPYYEANQSVTVKAADKGKYTSLESMKGKNLKFGAQISTVGADQIIEHFGEGALTRYDLYPVAIEALKRGDVDAVVMDAPAQKEAAKADPAIAVAFEFSVGDVYGIPVKKGDADMLARINSALTSIIADGTMAKLRQKWGI
jgi:ABC-type amino acid transport substrate-binding protein